MYKLHVHVSMTNEFKTKVLMVFGFNAQRAHIKIDNQACTY